MNIEYYIKRSSDGPNTFQVSKFEGDEQPKNEYRVVFHPVKLYISKCDCMAWRSKHTRPCKHIAMVQEFINAGEPQPFLLRR